MKSLIVGTRGSALAMNQTHWVIDQLQGLHPGLRIKTEQIVTRGDSTQRDNVPLSSFGEKGIFAKELETALLAGEIDFAVHSMKDMAHTLPAGLVIASVPERQDPRDVWIGATFDNSEQTLRVGTGSVRRRALLRSMRPNFIPTEIRGNIDSRIRKMRQGDYDAIILAAAGLRRLGLESNITHTFDPDEFVPDPGQGALAIECREQDIDTVALLATIGDPTATLAVRTERAFLRELGGGCHTPCGAHAVQQGSELVLRTLLALPDGFQIIRQTHSGAISDPDGLGQLAGAQLRQSALEQFPTGWNQDHE